ncbi:MAG: plasma-membrane proton-efflux P-type ATPase [Oscillospiraceae bacterium]|nr:plasma-membrane proton-efflux P-type ATPase [Oscillospiraceae bacterium]MCI2035683.1 plasma-membrane proton-efflux P-type ATPase [Oscillospiraceae bacterium]
MDLQTRATNEYRGMAPEKAMEILNSGLDGLSEAEAAERLRRFGPNEIKERKRDPVLVFLKRYWGPMPWLLEFAMVLTVLLGHNTESILIFILLTVNAIIGFFQSQNSQRAVELLKKRLHIRAKVLRNGQWTLKDAKEIVPGDILKLKLGDLVPADAFVLNGEISVDASSLTGESLPQDARSSDVACSGSIVRRGEASCIVVNTGIRTYFGKTVSLVQIARPKSKQQELMFGIVRSMMALGVAASIVVSCYAAYLHRDIFSILSLVTVFLIGAVPVALPAVMTIVQAVGALDLSKKGVLVTRLDSIEDAACVDVFCFDKTGTITQNRLAVSDCRALAPYGEEQVVKLAALASREEEMDAIDTAVLRYSETRGIRLEGCRQLSYLPFDPARKRTEAVVEMERRNYRIAKGAPSAIRKLCGPLSPRAEKEAENAANVFSARGCRTIAIAVSDAAEGENFHLAGLLALSDPPRGDSKAMIQRIKSLGIRPFLLTGDSQAIAREVAEQVGIGSRIRRAGERKGLNREEQIARIDQSDGFAEVYPEDKFQIVQLLQNAGHMVGMTGDGVNDSPALKQAELGTAVSSATDVAKASAGVVLTKPGLSEIIDTIGTSRQTYQRMLTWVINKVTKVVEVVVLFTAGYFWMHNMIISLLGMSLLVFANDFVTMSIATDRVVSTESPNSWKMKSIVSVSTILGALFALEDLFVVWVGISVFHLTYSALCTLVLLSLVFNTQFRILSVRERRHFWSSLPGGKLLFINLATMTGFALLGVSGGIVPALEPGQIAALLGIAIFFMGIIDFIKYGLFRAFHI